MLTFISGNTNKVRECERLLGVTLASASLPLEEIQSIDPLPVVEHKARLAYAALSRPVLVEDTGLAFAAWNGLPGALIKWFLGSLGPEGLCRMMRAETNRAATAITLLGYCDGESVRTFAGTVQGSVPRSAAGHGGVWLGCDFSAGGECSHFCRNERCGKRSFFHAAQGA